MDCQFCKDPVKPFDKQQKVHLVAAMDHDGHAHVHGDLGKKDDMRALLEVAAEETGISLHQGKLDRKEICFHNRQRIGDILMFTCAIRDFKKAYPDVRVNVLATAKHIFDHNPYIDKTLQNTPENTIKIGPSWLTNASNRIDWHFANAFRISMQDALGITIPQGESRPDIYITKDEWKAPRFMEKPYWVICTSGERGWGCKMYPSEKWQEFVSQNPDVMFVQIGSKEDNAKRLEGKNVIDHVGKTQDGKTGIRDLFKLFLNAEGSIGLVSFHMHLSGALYKPCIVIAGAREPVSFTRYQGHAYLNTEGMLPCATTTACWRCDIKGCKNLVGDNVPKCVDMISPDDITYALNQYYAGGRLSKKTPAPKPTAFKNVVDPIPDPITADLTKYGMEWGGGCITENDWLFMKNVIKDHKIKSVLEFGSGLSTLLMNDAGLKVKTYETNQGWIDKLKAINPKIDINIWTGDSMITIDQPKFDLAFVDGPAGGQSRELSTKLGAKMADVVIVHDANREFEKKWQEKYLKDAFVGPTKGGNRCHLWAKLAKPVSEPAKPTLKPASEVDSKAKSIKFVSTARGWGGCARSVTTIMKMLLAKGHKVEFIPFRNNVGSREFKACIESDLPDLVVESSYQLIKEPCDILVVYADDFVWEFANPEIIEAFTGLEAKRKIMILNYRRGKVGTLEWTRGWDKYMFLNSTQEKELLKAHPGVKTRVLAPCTNLDSFFQVQPNYNTGLRIVRHNSQGDTKFAKDFNDEVISMMNARKDIMINMMPGPSFVKENEWFKKTQRNAVPIPQFLAGGNLFWYSLPKGYMDMGPRVILEAMAAGLPILADDWGGARDRVTPETGWLCKSKAEHVEIIKQLDVKVLKQKGEAARARAAKEFIPENWIKEILD